MEALIKKALASIDVDYIEIHLEEREHSQVYFSGKEMDSIGTNSSYGGNVRVFYKGGWGFVSFNNPDKLLEYAKIAEKQARLTSSGSGGLKHQKPFKGTSLLDIEDDPRKITLEEKYNLTKHYNDMLISSPKIITTKTGYEDTYIKRYFYNNLGVENIEERIYCGVRFSAYAKDGANVQIAFDTIGETEGWHIALNHEEEVEKVAKDAVDLLKAEKVSAGKYTVIADPKLAGVFAHEAFGHLSEADHIYENERIKKIMQLGKRFGVDELSIVDDGTIKGKRGYYAYDDEGVPSQKTYLIKDGILVGRLHSKETAYIMGEELTGNARAITYKYPPIVRMSCTYIEGRDKSFEEMISEIDDGIYAVAAIGGMTELEQFTFSSAKAYRIKNGKVDKMLRDVILTGNVFETLMNIDAIGNDQELFGGLGGCGKGGQSPLPVSDGSPHIRIRNVIIGGK